MPTTSIATDVLVVGAGPAGVAAALRAADLGVRTVLVTRKEFGGMAANDGPVPVRTLAHAARLIRETRQLGQYGIRGGESSLDYPRLLERVREVVGEVRLHSAFRAQIESAGATVIEHAGVARFVDSHSIETEDGTRLRAEKVIICTGGTSRRLAVPGFELTATHSDAWSLGAVPPSMMVIGAGATGVQVASIFGAFGTRVALFQNGPRILPQEDQDVSAEVAAALRASGIAVHESFGTIQSFERTQDGIRMNFAKDGRRDGAEATLAVVAVGWSADTSAIRLSDVGVETDERGFVRVDAHLQTTAKHVFAAGDVTGRLMLVPQALHDGFIAATNAVGGPRLVLADTPSPIGSFTEPEYAHVGLNEAKAQAGYEVVIARIHFDSTTRTIIDGRKTGFCKLIVDRRSRRLLGCHVVGERAVEITQLAAVAMAAEMTVDVLARVPLSFPTYGGILGRVAARATRELNRGIVSRADETEDLREY